MFFLCLLAIITIFQSSIGYVKLYQLTILSQENCQFYYKSHKFSKQICILKCDTLCAFYWFLWCFKKRAKIKCLLKIFSFKSGVRYQHEISLNDSTFNWNTFISGSLHWQFAALISLLYLYNYKFCYFHFFTIIFWSCCEACFSLQNGRWVGLHLPWHSVHMSGYSVLREQFLPVPHRQGVGVWTVSECDHLCQGTPIPPWELRQDTLVHHWWGALIAQFLLWEPFKSSLIKVTRGFYLDFERRSVNSSEIKYCKPWD